MQTIYVDMEALNANKEGKDYLDENERNNKDAFRHKRMTGGYDITGREDQFIGHNGRVGDPSNVVTVVQDNGSKHIIHKALLNEWLVERIVERLGSFQKASLGELPADLMEERLCQLSRAIVVRAGKYNMEPFYPAQRKMLEDSNFTYIPK